MTALEPYSQREPIAEETEFDASCRGGDDGIRTHDPHVANDRWFVKRDFSAICITADMCVICGFSCQGYHEAPSLSALSTCRCRRFVGRVVGHNVGRRVAVENRMARERTDTMQYKSRGLRRRSDSDKWEVTLSHEDPYTGETV